MINVRNGFNFDKPPIRSVYSKPKKKHTVRNVFVGFLFALLVFVVVMAIFSGWDKQHTINANNEARYRAQQTEANFVINE